MVVLKNFAQFITLWVPRFECPFLIRRPCMQFTFLDFDPGYVVTKLRLLGGVSIPLLTGGQRQSLLEEALTYEYVRRPQTVGPSHVQQDFSSVDTYPANNPFFDFRDQWNTFLQRRLRELGDLDQLFEDPLDLNEIALQRYEPGSAGISAHRDSDFNRNLVCIFNLTGHGHFCLSGNREGTQSVVTLKDQPGNVILLRSAGFKTGIRRPFHFLTDIPELRISFGLRQVVPKK